MSDSEHADSEADTPQRIPEIDPRKEPEYVGAHSEITNPTCQNWVGETRDDVEQCGAEATHTVVMKSGGGLSEIAMCDDCGEPDDLDGHEREWSG